MYHQNVLNKSLDSTSMLTYCYKGYSRISLGKTNSFEIDLCFSTLIALIVRSIMFKYTMISIQEEFDLNLKFNCKYCHLKRNIKHEHDIKTMLEYCQVICPWRSCFLLLLLLLFCMAIDRLANLSSFACRTTN